MLQGLTAAMLKWQNQEEMHVLILYKEPFLYYSEQTWKILWEMLSSQIPTVGICESRSETCVSFKVLIAVWSVSEVIKCLNIDQPALSEAVSCSRSI